MSIQWYILRGEQSEGPFSSSELKLLADQHQITPDTLVKQGVSGPWVPAETIEGLFVEYHGAKPAPSTGSPPPVRYVKPQGAKAAVLATPPGISPPRAEESEIAPSSGEGSRVGLAESARETGRAEASSRVPADRPIETSSMVSHRKESGGTGSPMDQVSAETTSAGISEDVQSPIWYLRTPDGQQYGPVSKSRLDEWVAQGRVGQDCWVWRAGWAQWQGAGEVYGRLGQPLDTPAHPGAGVPSEGAEAGAAVGGGEARTATGGAAGIPLQATAPRLDDPQRWIGQTLGHYQLVECIGHGPSGVVYKARHVALERWVAIRLIPTGGDARLFEQLSQGLRAAVRLSHPHLVEVHDMGDFGQMVYVAMELMEGGSLGDWIRRAGRLPPPAALAIFHQVVSALAAVHTAGLLHRDIKPSNILFTGQGVAKLADLGLAALSDTRLRAGPSALGSSIYYMAPEILQGQPATARSDLYSLGATFYHALSGHGPGEGVAVEEFFRRRGDIPIAPIGSLVAGLPPAMAAMVDRLLLKDPHLRFSSAGEILEMWPRMAGTPPAGPIGSGHPPPAVAPPSSARRAAPSPGPTPTENQSGGWIAPLLQLWRNSSWKVRAGVGLIGVLLLLAVLVLLWAMGRTGGSSETFPQEPSSLQGPPPDSSVPEQPK